MLSMFMWRIKAQSVALSQQNSWEIVLSGLDPSRIPISSFFDRRMLPTNPAHMAPASGNQTWLAAMGNPLLNDSETLGCFMLFYEKKDGRSMNIILFESKSWIFPMTTEGIVLDQSPLRPFRPRCYSPRPVLQPSPD